VNSVSGAFALSTLFNWSTTLSLVLVAAVQITIAFIGHNLVQKVEKYLMPYLAVVFVLASIFAFSKGHYSYHNVAATFPGAFLVYVAAVYGYAAGWNPFASDYARYIEKGQSFKRAGWFAAAGLFISTTVLEIVGAVAVTAGMHAYGANTNPVGDFTHLLPGWLGKLVLLGIVGGSISANVLNIYSGSVSAVTLGIRFSNKASRAVMVLLVGVIGFILAHWAMGNPTNNLENFLLVMAYWIGPWLGVVAADKILRKGQSVEGLLFAKRENIAGPVSFLLATGVSIWLFSNQTYYTGLVAKHYGSIGDITFLVGFVLAFVLYFVLGGKQARAGK
jgi:purine-cytosine permease-like protein